MTWPFGDLLPLSYEEKGLNPSEYALELGKAAEHIVCADLILQGYRAFLSDQGLPYDVLLDLDGRIIRIQVKSTTRLRNYNGGGVNPRYVYHFDVRRRGKGTAKRLSDKDCDIVALVALDLRVTAYLPIEIIKNTVQLLPPGELPQVRTWRGGWRRQIHEWPIEDALKGPSAFKKVERIESPTHCKWGHEYAVVGLYLGRGCAECGRINMRLRREKKQEAANV